MANVSRRKYADVFKGTAIKNTHVLFVGELYLLNTSHALYIPKRVRWVVKWLCDAAAV